MLSSREIDSLLRGAVDDGSVPGVVAMATSRTGVCYQGAFGVRRAGADAPMTLDTVFWYASMTKALVATGAMQLVEQGRVALDTPISTVLPSLGSLQVLEGYDEAGAPQLRPARRPMTLRHLLTHTSGFGYDIWNTHVLRFMTENGLPSLMESRRRSLHQPLVADPGERWEYGISIDWVGQVIEAVSGQTLADYLHDHLLQPLGMVDTGFIIRSELRTRQASIHRRRDGGFVPIVHEVSQEPEFHMGGGGCYGTVGDYLAFIRMILDGGLSHTGAQVLKPETVDDMARNSIGDLKAGVLSAVLTDMSHPSTDFLPGMEGKWGLSFLINPEASAQGRSPGSLTWAGLANTYFWIDRRKGVGGVLATQILPFADPNVLDLFAAFERAVYRGQPVSAAA